jgi:hypothetical protein
MFKGDRKQLYKYLGVKTMEIKGLRHTEEFKFYWKSLWEKQYNNRKAQRLRREEKSKLKI